MARRSVYISLMSAGCVLALVACGMPGSHSDAPSVYDTSNISPPDDKMGPPAPASLAAAVKPTDLHPADMAWADHEDKNVAVALPVEAAPTTAKAIPVSVAAAPDASATDMNRRIDKLEKEVADMHNDMNMMMPALTKLVSSQQDLQQILARMDTAAGTANAPIADTGADKAAVAGNPRTLGPVVNTMDNDHTAAPLEVAGPPAKGAPLSHDQVPPPALPDVTDANVNASPVAVSSAVPPQPATPGLYAVSQIRFGEHNNMTRMVLDASGKVPYTYALDTSGTLMTLHLPQTDWKTAASAVPPGSKVIDSYTATPDGQGGYMVAVKLKQPVAVSWADVMPPATDGGYRVVFDLTPKS